LHALPIGSAIAGRGRRFGETTLADGREMSSRDKLVVRIRCTVVSHLDRCRSDPKGMYIMMDQLDHDEFPPRRPSSPRPHDLIRQPWRRGRGGAWNMFEGRSEVLYGRTNRCWGHLGTPCALPSTRIDVIVNLHHPFDSLPPLTHKDPRITVPWPPVNHGVFQMMKNGRRAVWSQFFIDLLFPMFLKLLPRIKSIF